jgi:hypothetical protein
MKTHNKLGNGETHQLKIARDSMKLSCIGCRCLGGPNHKESQEVILKLTNKLVKLDSDCTCKVENRSGYSY